MRISTNQFYTFNKQNLLTLGAKADALQTQVSTGKRINTASDDAVAYRRLETLKQGKADDAAFSGNITLTSSTLSQADVTLKAITDALQQAQEIAIKSNGGTLSAANRGTLADQLDAIVKNLVDYANVKDSRGSSIFASDDSTAVTKNPDGSFTLATTSPAAIPIGATTSIEPGASAAKLYGTSGGNILATISALATALRGTADTSAIAGTTGDALQVANDQAASMQASLGARAARVDLEAGHLKDVATDREATRTALEDVDVTDTITELQKTMTILQATQASFSKLSQLSLFDYLR